MPDTLDEKGYLDHQIEPLETDTVKAIVEQEIQDAIGGIGEGSDISEQRRLAIRYYMGRPMGNEIEGRSQVILTDVADTIEWIMPTLMEMLVPSGKQVGRITATRDGDDAHDAARNATLGVNHVIMQQNEGFSLLHDWFKTGLLEKNGIVKTYTETRMEPRVRVLRGLDEMEVLSVMEDGGLKVEHTFQYTEKIEGQDVVLYDLKVRNIKPRTQIRIDGVPPEEFLIARRSLKLNDETGFSAHMKKMTVGDLLALGFDKEIVLSIPPDQTPEFTLSRTERLSEEETFPIGTSDRQDVASREIWVTECYIKIDEDGDGYSELRKIVVVGQQAVHLVDDEEINHNPFSSLTPVPFPHKFFGLSIADLVMDLQKIRSVLLRQMLDNLYLANNPRTEIVEGQVYIEDLLTSRPGGAVRVRSPGMMREIQHNAFSPMAVQMLEYLEGVKENRTGITRYNQGQDSKSLNQTAEGINRIMTAAAARVKLIARIYAETGMKSLVKNVYRELVEGGHKPFQVQAGDGSWVKVDPSTWEEDFDVEIEVGLGVGEAAERSADMQLVLDLQKQLADAGMGGHLVTPENVYNATEALVESMHFRLPNRFFSNPKDQEPPPVKPPPAVQAAQERTKMEGEKRKIDSLKLEAEVQRDAALVEHRASDLAQTRELETKRMELDAATRIRIAEIQAEATLQAARERPKPNGADQPAAS